MVRSVDDPEVITTFINKAELLAVTDRATLKELQLANCALVPLVRPKVVNTVDIIATLMLALNLKIPKGPALNAAVPAPLIDPNMVDPDEAFINSLLAPDALISVKALVVVLTLVTALTHH